MRGLPVAFLNIQGNYWSSLRHGRRKNLRKKLKRSSALILKEQVGINSELAAQLFKLYLQTYERAQLKFEKLNVDYFIQTSSISRYLLFYEGNQLIGFVQLICKPPRMVLKYIGMDYERNKKHGLYFASILQAMEVCIRDNFTEMESGITCYEFKKKIGSELIETFVYYRHANPVVHWILERVKFLFEPSAAELR